jgi:threonylcarbamoyladenosine tRNA methylthiotransferase MtaB
MRSAPPTYSVVTFGCRVNQADSLAIEGDLRARGAIAVAPEHADLLIVNTCSVTASADQGARQTIRRVVRANPGVEVVVTGCYATRRPAEVGDLPNVVRVITNAQKDDLVAVIGGEAGLSTARRFTGGDGPCGAVLEPGVAGRTAFTLRVQTGCDERCSYCIIPATRGTSRSRAIDEVVADVTRAVDAGYKEIAITGVHLGSYGRDRGDGTTLVSLLRVLAAWQADALFRISSLEPMDCTPEIIDLVAGSPRLAPHFHLPLQHGADAMLRAMRRPYTAGYYRSLVERIRRHMPHASIGTDLIAGFPGESEAHFREMHDLLRELPVTHAHVFPYSDRPGTEASALPDKVDGVAIRERGRVLRAVAADKARAFRASQSGTTQRALTVDDGWSAVTRNYLKVKLEAQQPRNEWLDVVVQ